MSHLKLYIKGIYIAKRKITLLNRSETMGYGILKEKNEETLRKGRAKLIELHKDRVTRAGDDYKILFTL